MTQRFAFALVVSALVALVPATAQAHGRLKSSVPSAGAQLTIVPRELRLDFSESPDLTFSNIRLTSANGREIPLGVIAYPADSRRSLVAAVAAALEVGTYTVMWQMAGDDGHPVRGQFAFTIATGAAGVGVAPVGVPTVANPKAASTAGDSAAMANMHHDPVSMPEGLGFDSESPLYVVIRWLQFIGVLLAVGAVSFHAFVLRFIQRGSNAAASSSELAILPAVEMRAASIGLVAAMLLGTMLVLRLVAQGVAMHGSSIGADPSLMLPMLGKTMWGWGWLVQLVGIVLAGVGFRGARNAREDSAARWSRWWGLAALGAVMIAFSLGMASHAASSPKLRALAMLADGLHVLAASCWLGSLALVLFAGVAVSSSGPSDEGGAFVRDLVNGFSPVALVSAGVATTTGVFAAWLHVGTIPNLWSTRYGLILMTKLAILGILSITGFYNWRFVKPSLGTSAATVHLQRSARVELAVAVLVLLVTAVLVASPTSMDMVM